MFMFAFRVMESRNPVSDSNVDARIKTRLVDRGQLQQAHRCELARDYQNDHPVGTTQWLTAIVHFRFRQPDEAREGTGLDGLGSSELDTRHTGA